MLHGLKPTRLMTYLFFSSQRYEMPAENTVLKKSYVHSTVGYKKLTATTMPEYWRIMERASSIYRCMWHRCQQSQYCRYKWNCQSCFGKWRTNCNLRCSSDTRRHLTVDKSKSHNAVLFGLWIASRWGLFVDFRHMYYRLFLFFLCLFLCIFVLWIYE